VLPEAVEVAAQVDLHDAMPTPQQRLLHLDERLMRRPTRSRSVGALREIGLEDRLEDPLQGALHHAISNRRDRDHAHPAS
jgi:hypothetical protein